MNLPSLIFVDDARIKLFTWELLNVHFFWQTRTFVKAVLNHYQRSTSIQFVEIQMFARYFTSIAPNLCPVLTYLYLVPTNL